MKQDIREMSYVFSKEKQDKDFIYTIDLVLYQFFEKEFDEMLNNRDNLTDYLDAKYLELLKDRDSIISYLIENNYKGSYFCNIFIDNTYKLYYLLDTEFLKQLDRCKKYYEKRLKTRNKVKDKELEEKLKMYFEYCYINCKKKNNKDILKLMSSSDFRKASIKDLHIDVNKYKDFDKTYNKTLSEFKKIYKDDLDAEKDDKDKLAFGWRFYAVVKAIECLFKM